MDGTTAIEDEHGRLEYALEIALRLLDKAPDEASHRMYQIQVDALQALLSQAEERLEAEQQEMDWCDAMVAEMQADLQIDPMDGLCGADDDQDIPF